MHFDLTDDQKALREVLVSMFEKRFGGAQGVEAVADTALDRELWGEVSELGLAGILVAEEHGGLGMGLLTLSVVAEVLGTFAVPAPVVANALAAWTISATGSDALREKWLGRLLGGDAIAAFALSEEAGSMPGQWSRGTAPPTGRKTGVERAAEADLFIVGLAGGGLGVVEAGAPGVAVDTFEPLDRTRPVADVTFSGAAVESLAADAAFVSKLIDAMLITLAADGLGAAFAIQSRAIGYAKERKQYGHLIGSFQAMKHQLADMSVEIEPARPLYWYAAHAWDTDRPDAHRVAAVVKAHIGEVSVNVCRAAVEAFGGIGYTWEFPAHLFLKRAMAGRTMLGTPAVHRERAAQLAGWSKVNDEAKIAVASAA